MIKVTVCIGSSCHLKGSRQIVETLQYLIKENKLEESIELGGAFCMGKCTEKGVNITVDGEHFSVLPEECEEFFKKNILTKVGK